MTDGKCLLFSLFFFYSVELFITIVYFKLFKLKWNAFWINILRIFGFLRECMCIYKFPWKYQEIYRKCTLRQCFLGCATDHAQINGTRRSFMRFKKLFISFKFSGGLFIMFFAQTWIEVVGEYIFCNINREILSGKVVCRYKWKRKYFF